jgi:hypothetical protein
MTEPIPLAIAGDHCRVHGYHWPPVQRTVRHHVKPEAAGGPAEPWNLVETCDTGHYNIHEALKALQAGRKPEGTREEVRLARLGLRWTTMTNAEILKELEL